MATKGKGVVELLREASNRMPKDGSTFFPASEFDGEATPAPGKIQLQGYVSNKELAELVYYIAGMLET